MKKFIIGLMLGLMSCFSYAGSVVTELPFYVETSTVNSTSPWFPVNTDNIGVAVFVTEGSCIVEYAFQSTAVCKANNAIAFPWLTGSVAATNKKFESQNGVSCVRLNCEAGSGVMFVRRH